MKNKVLVLAVVVGLVVLSSGCKKEVADPIIGTWILKNVHSLTTNVTDKYSPIRDSVITAIIFNRDTLTTIDTGFYGTDPMHVSPPYTYKSYSLKLTIQKDGTLNILELSTPGYNTLATQFVNTINNYWNYSNATAKNDELTLSGLSTTIVGVASDTYTFSLTKGTLTLVFNNYSTFATPIPPYNYYHTLYYKTTNTLTFTK